MQRLKFLQMIEVTLESYSKPFKDYLPPEVLSHPNFASAAHQLLRSLDELASLDVAKKRAERFAPQIEAKKFCERLVWEQGEHQAIAGIRFKKLNPDFPFIFATLNFVPTAKDFASIKAAIQTDFSDFRLQGIAIRQAPGLLSDVPHETWSHTVWGRTAQDEEASLAGPVQAQFEAEFPYYDVYRREYQALLESDPKKNAYLRFEDQEDLEAAAKRGLLINVYDKQGWGGTIAAREQDLYGLPCLYVFELFLCARLRGKGLAVPLERSFLNSLSKRYPFVFGHIDHTNLPSLKTALAVGRRVIETEHFFPLP